MPCATYVITPSETGTGPPSSPLAPGSIMEQDLGVGTDPVGFYRIKFGTR